MSENIVRNSLLRRNAEPSVLDYGKLPPQSKDMECAVLGAIMSEREAIWKVINLLHEECFYVDAHQRIWKVISELYHENEPIDSLTITERLKKHGNLDACGGQYYIAQLASNIGSSANVESHAFVVKETYLKRKLITICSSTIQNLYEDRNDFFDVFDSTLTEIENVNRELNRIQQTSFMDSVIDRSKELKEAGENKTYRTGVTTHLNALDNQTMGFQASDFIIIAGRPSMGKTAIAIDFMRTQAERGISVGFFSLEMSTHQIIDRMFAAETEIDMKQIKRGGMHANEWKQLDDATIKLMNYSIVICDKGGLSINDIVSISKGWKLKNNIQILYIDYLQLCSGSQKSKNGNREGEISEVSRRLKQLAKELHIPVIALSQLSRECEKRTDKRPQLSDLRESGAIEQDADLVIFPFREEYYNDNAEKGLCELNIAKYRNGKTGAVKCSFNLEHQKFTDYQIEYTIPKNLKPVKDITESNKQDDTPF